MTTTISDRRDNDARVVGQILVIDGDRIRIYLHGTSDEEREAWIPRPPTLPECAEGDCFEAWMCRSIRTFVDLAARPEAIHGFEFTPPISDDALAELLAAMEGP